MLLSNEIRVNYSRTEHTVLSRQNVSQLAALVIGAGALGNAVVQALGLLGVKSASIVDPDMVEESNLTRSVLYRLAANVGRPKASALVESARTIFPDTRWEAMDCEFADVGFETLGKMDVLFSCVDRESARTEIAYASTRLNVPCCDGGLGGMDYARGRVSYFPGRNGACFCCILPAGKKAEILTTWSSDAHSCSVERSEDPRRVLPSTPTMSSIIGSMQVDLALRSCLNTESEGFTVELDLEKTAKLTQWSIVKSKECPFHDEFLEHRLTGDHRTTAEDLLNRVGIGFSVMLDWPVCIEALCFECAHRWTPLQRLGRFRRSGCCPQCRSTHVSARQVLRFIHSGSKWANIPLVELGIPRDHRHAVTLVSASAQS